MDKIEHHKEVYAYFGLAIFRAQLLEHAIVNALVVCDLIPNRRHLAKSREEWSAQVDQFMDGHFENTAGTLMKALRKAVTVSDELEQNLRRTLKLRNFLVHHFFRERVASWFTDQGRADMIAELEAAGNQFGEADELVGATVQSLKDWYGLTQEQEEQLMEELRAAAISGSRLFNNTHHHIHGEQAVVPNGIACCLRQTHYNTTPPGYFEIVARVLQ